MLSKWSQVCVCAMCGQADTGSAVRAIERIKNSGDQLVREYCPDTKAVAAAKSSLDDLYVVLTTKLKTEANYYGSAANLVFGDVSVSLAALMLSC